jgi:hypothetical protein
MTPATKPEELPDHLLEAAADLIQPAIGVLPREPWVRMMKSVARALVAARDGGIIEGRRQVWGDMP